MQPRIALAQQIASAADAESRAELEHLQTAAERHGAECQPLILGMRELQPIVHRLFVAFC
jgi:hypothetical protein